MASDGPAARLLARLEARVTRDLHGTDRAALAFSGGLGSLLVAAVLRKQADLACRTVGVGDASDVKQAKVLASHLDFRVEVRLLTPSAAVALGRAVARRHPRWTERQVLDSVPLEAARDDGDAFLFAGLSAFGAGPWSRAALVRESVRAPLAAGSADPGTPRRTLIAAARLLGIPKGFATVARRPPSSGSGVAPGVRSEAQAAGASVRGLLRGPEARRSGP